MTKISLCPYAPARSDPSEPAGERQPDISPQESWKHIPSYWQGERDMKLSRTSPSTAILLAHCHRRQPQDMVLMEEFAINNRKEFVSFGHMNSARNLLQH